MIAYLLSKLITMLFGLLYPAYCSFKAVKTKDVKEYVHWMMYWIVFAIFSVVEVFSDTFIGCWFPFYYELKIIFIIWLLAPSTRGGSYLYRRFIHPKLNRHEKEIDAYIADLSSHTAGLVRTYGSKVFTYATDFILNTVMKGLGGKYTPQMLRSESAVDGFPPDFNRNNQRENFMDITNDSEEELEIEKHVKRKPAAGATKRVKNLSGNSPGESHRRRPASVDDETQLYEFGQLAKQQSMMNLGLHDEELPRRTRKKATETDSIYSTLPRKRKTAKKTTHK